MTTPFKRWPELSWFFEVLHQDFEADFADDADSCLSEAVSEATTAALLKAVGQWHDAFDETADGDVATIVNAMNPWWDGARFGGYRAWAEWVRDHLERELSKRQRLGGL